MKSEEQTFASMAPAALRPELAERFLSAMQQAAGEEELAAGLEQRLRRLSPAPLGDKHTRRCLNAMQAPPVSRYDAARYRLHRWGVAAVLFLLCSAGVFMVVNSSAMATVPAGLACRIVKESHAGETVQWGEGQTALRTCDVLYEDSFVLDGEEDSTITVRVPVRTRVLIEDEVI